MRFQEHKVIWLQPWCNKCESSPGDGRQWCKDDVWDACDECERRAVKYVLAKHSPQGSSGVDNQ